MPRRPTLRDIAKETGFSMATVSSALNNDPRVRASTRELVRAAAERMSYRPDPALLALSAHRWDGRRNLAGMTIAYVTGQPKELSIHSGHRVMIESMKRRAESLGYRFYTHLLDDLGGADSANRILTSRGTSGLLIGPVDNEAQFAGFDWRGFSAIAVDLGHWRPPLTLVTNNPITCVQVAWQRILKTGRQRIGVVLAPDTQSDFFNEQRAWALRLQHELPRAVPRIPIHDYVSPKTFARWMKRHEPDAIISYSEWLIEGIERLGRRVPDDVAFVTMRKDFKEYPSVPLRPEIAGMIQHHEHLGHVAVDQVDLLIRRNAKGLAPYNLTIYIDLSWHPGSTLPDASSTRSRPAKAGQRGALEAVSDS